MDHDDPHNTGISPEFINTDEDNGDEIAHEGAEIESLELTAAENPHRPETKRNFDLSTTECWHLEDLYCDGLSFAHAENAHDIALNDKHGILSWAAFQLSASPTGRAMLAEAEAQGWAVALEPLEGPDFHLDVPDKLIILDDQDLLISALGRSEYFKNAVLVSLIRALRDVWQEKRHGAFDINYGPEHVMKLERVRAADLDSVAVLTAWELRGEGQPSLWRHLIGAEDGDIAMRFSGFLERDPSSLFNGKALAAAFAQWFRDETRVNACDHETLNYLDTLVQAGADTKSFGNTKLTPVGLEILSCLPDKTAYLQGKGAEILNDPFYSGLTTEINQAHFMQILYDIKVTRIQDVPFADAALAEKIFPNGEFTLDDDVTIH